MFPWSTTARSNRLSSIVMWGLALNTWAQADEPRAEEVRFFESNVRPLFVEYCQECHGAEVQKGSLRLDGLSPMLAGGDSGPAIVPGQPEQSLLVRAVSYEDADLQMPPTGRLPDDKIAVLATWIRQGAPWPHHGADDSLAPRKQFEITEEDQQHWSFQPVRRPEVPQVKRQDWVVNPIDSFVMARLEREGLSPSPPASRRELIRRVYFDLIGLPPSPDEVAKFIADPSEQTYEQLIDSLLASSHYGERWARHWLDLVRYAHTNGYDRDREKPHVWRYRDYVIQAFNEDKPYDRFVLEQFAGDELPDATPDSIIATGVWRLGPYVDEPDDKLVAISDDCDDMVRTASETFLGLTVGCARCHDHKFDPISQEDYYRLVACFRNVLTYFDLTGATTANYDPVPEANFIPLLDDERLFVWRVMREQIDFLRAWATHNGQQTKFTEQEVQKLLEQEVQKLLKSFRESESPMALAVRETGQVPPPTHVLFRGDPHKPGAEVTAGGLAVLTPQTQTADFSPAPAPTEQCSAYRKALTDWGVQPTSGRRLALASWIASKENPLTARVMVNRLWQHHFGHGIIRTPSDFGRMGRPPSHPELLDWLAAEFVANGWEMKSLHKQIVLSSTYRQSSRADNVQAHTRDPDNMLLWRQNFRRLEAEVIRDAVLAVSGRLNLTMGGSGFFPTLPPEVLAKQAIPGIDWKQSTPEEQSQRSVYMYIKRTIGVPLMEAFDSPVPDKPQPGRAVTTIAPQALIMLNGAFIDEQAAAFAERLQRECGSSIASQIERAFQLGLARSPTPDEMADVSGFIERQRQAFAESGATPADAERKAMATLGQLVFNLNEFVYID